MDPERFLILMRKQGLRELAKLCLKHTLKHLQTGKVSEPQKGFSSSEWTKSLSQSFTGNETQ